MRKSPPRRDGACRARYIGCRDNALARATLGILMTEDADWKCVAPPFDDQGHGHFVALGDQRGYVKGGSNERERLAFLLAQQLGVPVAKFTIETVNGESVGVSHVHSSASRPLKYKYPRNFEPCWNESAAALREASGLLAFVFWIGAYDHGDCTNLVAETIGNDAFRIVAIDFSDAFKFEMGNDCRHKLRPEALIKHLNPAVLESAISAIESISADTILECCREAQLNSGEANRIAEALNIRRALLRDVFQEELQSRA